MSSDLKKDFPGIAGFSRTNLYYMKKCFLYFKEFAVPDNFVPQLEGQTDPIIVPQLVRQLPWGHIKVIISKIKDNSVALFYISEIINNNWSRDTLELQIKSDLYNRKGRSINDFRNTLPEPQFAGKMNFYLSAVDSLLKAEGDNPTIGIMLCRDKNNIETEFALRDINKPMGISEFQLTGILPENLKSSLPSIEEIEREINMVREKMAKYG
jgi:hypothetical protein|nr:PDDEXK nuclease domain-containing protein [Candidatus Delongbacteria bacterium]